MVATLRNRTTKPDARFDLDAPPGVSRVRRAPEIAAGVLVMLVCALGALWWHASSTAESTVLALRNPIGRGHVMTVDDLQLVRIDTDDRVAVLSERDAAAIVGRVARSDLAAGTFVTEELFSAGSLIGPNDGVVGLSLEAGQFPSLKLAAGDVVTVVMTPPPSDPKAAEPQVLVARATVVEVAEVGVQGRMFVAVQVAQPDAPKVAAAAAANRVRLVQIAGG